MEGGERDRGRGRGRVGERQGEGERERERERKREGSRRGGGRGREGEGEGEEEGEEEEAGTGKTGVRIWGGTCSPARRTSHLTAAFLVEFVRSGKGLQEQPRCRDGPSAGGAHRPVRSRHLHGDVTCDGRCQAQRETGLVVIRSRQKEGLGG